LKIDIGYYVIRKKTTKTDKTSKPTKDCDATTGHIHAQIILDYALYIMKKLPHQSE